jgi:phage baseplate assembly protein W
MSVFSSTLDAQVLGILNGTITPATPTPNPQYSDWKCGDDLDPFGRDVLPLETYAQDIYHLLTTNKFCLIEDPDFGFGLEDYLGKPLPQTLAFDIETACKLDDRCNGAQCTIAKVAPGTPMNINGQIITADANSYSLNLQVAVESTFLNLALALTPSGIVRVF